jgi:hypothetical protein
LQEGVIEPETDFALEATVPHIEREQGLDQLPHGDAALNQAAADERHEQLEFATAPRLAEQPETRLEITPAMAGILPASREPAQEPARTEPSSIQATAIRSREAPTERGENRATDSPEVVRADPMTTAPAPHQREGSPREGFAARAGSGYHRQPIRARAAGSEETADPAEPRPEIHISIGTIELRVPRADATPPARPFRPRVTLEEFLRRKSEAGE